jgi:phosphosulfolactate phosphohydrolase-like enzyme
VIPAGLTSDPDFDAQEDRAAAAYLASLAVRRGAELGEGAEACEGWIGRIEAEGLPALFDSAPHAAKLRKAGLDADVAFCAQTDLTAAVPCAAGRAGGAVRCVQWRGHE